MEKRFPGELKQLDDAQNWSCKEQRRIDKKIQYFAQKRLREHDNHGEVVDQRKAQDGARQRQKEANIAKGMYKPFKANQTKKIPNRKNIVYII